MNCSNALTEIVGLAGVIVMDISVGEGLPPDEVLPPEEALPPEDNGGVLPPPPHPSNTESNRLEIKLLRNVPLFFRIHSHECTAGSGTFEPLRWYLFRQRFFLTRPMTLQSLAAVETHSKQVPGTLWCGDSS